MNAVAPGPTDTGMLTRFTGTTENKAALVDDGSDGSARSSGGGRRRIVFIASDEASSSPATSSTSMAVKPTDKSGPRSRPLPARFRPDLQTNCALVELFRF